ncbi:hypothetical protein HDU96_007332 [Phlyctochytrium bullatum]|nr:hypothetical protein HDU96_007332 [Phlyctochytrium bullatum]
MKPSPKIASGFGTAASPIVRKYLTRFVKLVHPDLFQNFAKDVRGVENVRQLNQTSLASLNSLLTAAFPTGKAGNSARGGWSEGIPDAPVEVKFVLKREDAVEDVPVVEHKLSVWPTTQDVIAILGKESDQDLAVAMPSDPAIAAILQRSLDPPRLADVRRAAIAYSFLRLCQTASVEISPQDWDAVREPVAGIAEALVPLDVPRRGRPREAEQKASRSVFASSEFDACIRSMAAAESGGAGGADMWRGKAEGGGEGEEEGLFREELLALQRLVTEGNAGAPLGSADPPPLQDSRWITFHPSLKPTQRLRTLRGLTEAFLKGERTFAFFRGNAQQKLQDTKRLRKSPTPPVLVGHAFSRRMKGTLEVPWNVMPHELELWLKMHADAIRSEARIRGFCA